MVRHLAIIMDGNRRFSSRLLKEPWQGHEWGQKKLSEVLEWVRDAGVKELTLYAFSLQNFDRPKQEFDYLMNLFVKACDDLLSRDDVAGSGVRVRFVGEIDRFPLELVSRMQEIMTRTQNNTSFMLNVCVAYGGREELVGAVKSLARKVEQGLLSSDKISMESISASLPIGEPDLIIRTGGERRTSNFLLWQSWYSEWCFVDTLWPEFSREEFLSCFEEFNARKRRFGR